MPDRIFILHSLLGRWLKNEDNMLLQAVNRTVESKLFAKEDIEYQLSVFRENLRQNQLAEWATTNQVKESNRRTPQAVLCLHAGNIPLVGLQDVLAVLMSGHKYLGKISKKDPFLIPSFLEFVVRNTSVFNISTQLNLVGFANQKADAVLFSGSENSIQPVLSELKRLNISHPKTSFLIRKARFSVAFLQESLSHENALHVINASLRYRGKGCRSVAAVVSPLSLASQQAQLKEAYSRYRSGNGSPGKSDFLKVRHALNVATGVKDIFFDDFLIEEDESSPGDIGILKWITGGEDKLREIISKSEKSIQAVYSDSGSRDNYEPLYTAQSPPLYWKPDGIDPLRFLMAPEN